ncbi:UAP1 [Mytilus edulis]|uniref:UAP1 n=1 Tax=Mytilus edulis TaxID=6550 RepID=A0A8S3TFJ7_MYTED|nr:UAP1 [Mytilus edulis]
MESRGIKHVHVYCVDNILVKMADPVFIGFCMAKGARCGAKILTEMTPLEISNDKTFIVYTYDDKSQDHQAQEEQLAHHVAKKKIPYVGENLETIKPSSPNGIKMEKFVFDVFHFASAKKEKGSGDNQKDADEENGIVCEISPLVSYAGEGLEDLVKEKSFVSPLYLEQGPSDEKPVVRQGERS